MLRAVDWILAADSGSVAMSITALTMDSLVDGILVRGHAQHNAFPASWDSCRSATGGCRLVDTGEQLGDLTNTATFLTFPMIRVSLSSRTLPQL